jgi:hypothetical protein
VDSKASRKPQIRRRAWAVLIALLPAGVCWAGGPGAGPADGLVAAAPPPPLVTLNAPAPDTAPSPFRLAPARTTDDAPDGGVDERNKNVDLVVQPAGCATCGGFHNDLDGPAYHASFGCSGGSCIPGRQPCATPFCGDHIVGQFLNNLYQCLCCPDPCYQPKWVPAANASFFTDYARPRTLTRFRYDNLNNMIFPDRNQFFMKSIPINTRNPFMINGVQLVSNPSARLQRVSMYQEVATEKAAFFIEVGYRQVNPLFSPTQAGFDDLSFGSKALLFDCEMLQVTFQFRTFMPTGNSANQLGTGHVSLDPSLLASLKLSPSTYFQAQLGNWIPLGATARQGGGIFYWNTSLNQVLCEFTPDSPLIGTLEMNGCSFEDGGYTVPFKTTQFPNNIRGSGGGVSYFNIGPGLRWSICNTVDFGGAVTFATTSNHWADPWFRFEVRFLF